MSDRMLAAALAYARLGWPVFPCRGKVPAIPKEHGGSGCHDATTDPRQITLLWRQYAGANIGIATREHAGFWALDVDPRHGGDASLAAIESQHTPLQATVEQSTGSGGRHLLFRLDPTRPVRNRAGIRPGIDSRGDGGYIIAAPSVHPDTGRAYAWRPDRHPLRHPIAAAPDWLLSVVTPPLDIAAPQPTAAPPIDGDCWGPTPRYARAALMAACNAIARAPIGQQDATLVREAFSVGTLVAGGHMPALLARDALVWAGGQMAGDPRRRPWLPGEINRKVDAAIARAAAHPRTPRATA